MNKISGTESECKTSEGRICAKCGEWKTLEAFYVRSDNRRPGSACKSCRSLFRPQRPPLAPRSCKNCGSTFTLRSSKAGGQLYCSAECCGVRARARARDKHLLRNYGITAADFDSKVAEQGMACAICKVSRDRCSRNLSVDHDHASGAVRGVLCSLCNLGVGYFRDNPQLLRLAADYLELDWGQ